MIHQSTLRPLRSLFTTAALLLLASIPSFGHCDGMDGPVVKAARQALDEGNVNLVLIWVQQKDEAEIRRVFEDTEAVRALGAPAKDLADRYFFETLVRLHRAGEGASYDGLKSAGRDLGPAIPAADRALGDGSAEQLKSLLTEGVQKGLQEQFAKALARKKFRSDDVAAGREYVRAYVEFVHYVERIYEVSIRPENGHSEEPASEGSGVHLQAGNLAPTEH